jgi:uncharacterized protein YuzE
MIYIYFAKHTKKRGSVAITLPASDETNLDFDKSGNLIGIELLGESYELSGEHFKAKLNTEYSTLPAKTRKQLLRNLKKNVTRIVK